jgi:4-amino-4-deoxy-L-arabinose transferase-like glycosyltransferase
MSRTIPIIILLVLSYFIIFMHLGRQPFRVWDEGRLVYNSYEMMENGNLVVTYFDGKPDTYNIKPPLMIWCQSLSMKLFGVSELSYRLPAAIFGFLTCMTLLIFCWRYLKNFWMGIFSALVLLTTKGYITDHGVRYGEYDSPLVFFITLYALLFFLYFNFRKPKYIYAGVTALVCAVLTKGVAGMFLVPVVAGGAFFFPDVRKIFTSRHFYFSILIFLFFVPGYYLLRNYYDHGYIQNVYDNEITGRYASAFEQHKESFWFYFDQIRNSFLGDYYLFIPCGFLAGIFSIDLFTRRFILFVSCCAVFLFIILSTAQTKLFWYIYPIVPFLAILTGYFVWLIFKILSDLDMKRLMKYNLMPFAFVFIFFLTPVRNMINKVYLAPEAPAYYRDVSIGYFMQNLISGKERLNEPVKYVFSSHHFHMDFYAKLLRKKNILITYSKVDDLKAGDLVLCSLEEDEQFIKQHYVAEKVRDDQTRFFYRIYQRL